MEKTESEQWIGCRPTSIDEAVDAAKSGLIASHGVGVKAHRERVSR